MLLCVCNVAAGVYDGCFGSVFSTLGSTLSTLGNDIWGVGCSGILSIRFNWVANVMSALRTGSPACKIGVVVDGGCVSMVIISLAACLRKSFNFIAGNGIVVGKKVTVSQSLMVRVLGK